jgi:hypothetical protein
VPRRATTIAFLLALAAPAVLALVGGAGPATGPGGWDNVGTGATPTSPALNGIVYSLTPAGDSLYVGGNFTDAAGIANADHLALWDGSAW